MNRPPSRPATKQTPLTPALDPNNLSIWGANTIANALRFGRSAAAAYSELLATANTPSGRMALDGAINAGTVIVAKAISMGSVKLVGTGADYYGADATMSLLKFSSRASKADGAKRLETLALGKLLDDIRATGRVNFKGLELKYREADAQPVPMKIVSMPDPMPMKIVSMPSRTTETTVVRHPETEEILSTVQRESDALNTSTQGAKA